MSFKTKLKIVIVIILIAAGSYWYWWYDRTIELRQEAEQVIEEAGRFSEVKGIIDAEFTRCQDFITQEEGEFGSFEYCKRFIDWVDGNGLRGNLKL